jgi:TonB family protein
VSKPVPPVFPAKLLGAVQVTTVVVEVIVDEQGRVSRARIVKGDSRAHEAALRAAIQWPVEPPARGASERAVALSFTFRTLPATTPAKELATVFPDPYAVEVRARVATSPPKVDGRER